MMFDAEWRVCLRMHHSGHARQGSSAAPAFARFGDCRSNFLAELRIDDSSTAHTNVHAAIALSIAVATRLHRRSTTKRTSTWCQSHRARPCSRSPTDLCPRSPSSACAARTSQRPTHAWAQCHQYWVCAVHTTRGGLISWTKTGRMNRLAGEDHEKHGLTQISQVAGHRQDTACKAVQH
jgi:hypothetical protein